MRGNMHKGPPMRQISLAPDLKAAGIRGACLAHTPTGSADSFRVTDRPAVIPRPADHSRNIALRFETSAGVSIGPIADSWTKVDSASLLLWLSFLSQGI